MSASDLASDALGMLDNQPAHRDIKATEGSVREGVVLDGYELDRWSKYGHDRAYFRSSEDGYIDLDSGAVKEDAPVANVEVEQDGDETWVVYYVEEHDADYSAEKPVAAIRRD